MKRFIAASAVAAVAGLAAACSNPGASGTESSSDVPTDGTAEIQAQELTVWVNPADPDAVMNVWTRFEEETGVSVEIIEMPADAFESGVQTRWTSGERPDILEYHATSLFWALNPEQNMYDLSNMPFVEREREVLDAAGSLNGKVYAAITDSPSLFGIFYNKKVFEEYGLDVPETFDDLSSICSTLQDEAPDVTPIWESGGSGWSTQIVPGLMYMSTAQQDGNWAQQVLDQETTFDGADSPFVDGLTRYKDFQDEGCFNSDAVTAQFEDGIAAVSGGDAAMIALPTGLIDQFQARLDDDLELTNETIGFAYPSAGGAVSAWAPNVAGTWYVPRTGDPERESTALAFIQWATEEGYQDFVDESGSFPILEGADAPDVSGFRAEVADAYEESTAYAFNSNLVGFNVEFPNYMTGLLSGAETPQSVAEQSQTAFEQAARAAGLPGW
ncbi:extracellular solute-binding protein [Phycicoccus sp. BSK3Z-2]|uniref:Extracellular solute-binding protein n=1 Tax=Phycicoccus avicenniae TaxID=2828860 RepID=A0A941D5Y6_9MICO|nr:extracellular solute-binding protein [Phycicoccus avicenniae]MBR7741753.1 extracellular solute-binding protein [Phycicoccus avicenniae]